MPKSRYVVGIDLGTTNSRAVVRGPERACSRASSIILPIPQLTAAGTVEERPVLPSFLYLPNAEEFPEGSLAASLGQRPQTRWPASSRGVTASKVPARLVVVGKELAQPPGCGPHERVIAVARPAGSGTRVAGRSFGALPPASGGRVESRVRKSPARAAGDRPHGAGVVRRRRARTDHPGRARGRASAM